MEHNKNSQFRFNGVTPRLLVGVAILVIGVLCTLLQFGIVFSFLVLILPTLHQCSISTLAEHKIQTKHGPAYQSIAPLHHMSFLIFHFTFGWRLSNPSKHICYLTKLIQFGSLNCSVKGGPCVFTHGKTHIITFQRVAAGGKVSFKSYRAAVPQEKGLKKDYSSVFW